jgi:predicted transcriptional regulator
MTILLIYTQYVSKVVTKDIYLNYKFITVGLDENLKEAIDLLKRHKVHRIIIEEKSSSQITGFISQETIFDYFINNYYSTENINFFKVPLKFIEKNLMPKSMVSIKAEETIVAALQKFWDYKISIIPVYEGEENNIVGFVFLKDIFYLFSNSDKFSVSC